MEGCTRKEKWKDHALYRRRRSGATRLTALTARGLRVETGGKRTVMETNPKMKPKKTEAAWACRLRVKVAEFAQADPIAFAAFDAAAEYYVIEHLDVQELASPNQIPCDFDVSLAGSWISARVIMHEN